MDLPTISYDDFVNAYFSTISDARLRERMFNAYRQMIEGVALSDIYTGRTYNRVRDALFSVNFITRSNNYVPITGRRIPRLFPMGEYLEFDIYNRKPYEKRGKRYTIQIHFNIWTPYGFLLSLPNIPRGLFKLFFPIAEYIFRRVNYGASLYAMDQKQNVEFTIGISHHSDSIIHNVDTVSISITKVEASGVNSYIYDFIIRYQWRFEDKGGGVYNIDLCHLSILEARSCRTGLNLFDFVASVTKEKEGREITRGEYYTIRTKCAFRWRLYIPPTTPLCRGIADLRAFV